MRSQSVLQLLQSVREQSLYPDEILIVDGSTNSETETILKENQFSNLYYFSVPPEHQGLTKQRNYGIERVGEEIEVVCFLDDDVVLKTDYFEVLLETFHKHSQALGVGGYIIDDETHCEFVGYDYQPKIEEFYFDGWKRKDSSRFILRKKLGLDSDCPPGFSPLFSHSRSLGFLPPSGKTYEVEMLMGGVSSFKKEVFKKLKFSNYFEGYGLYEDADFTLRVAQIGKLYVNTEAQLYHDHVPSGRPNEYQYGKMVVRNGWYVWRVKNPKPSLNTKLKWHLITILLIVIRFSNIFTTKNRQQALAEASGRTIGWIQIIIKSS